MKYALRTASLAMVSSVVLVSCGPDAKNLSARIAAEGLAPKEEGEKIIGHSPGPKVEANKSTGPTRLLSREDFRKAFRGVWAPPVVNSTIVSQTFSGSYATHEQSLDGKHIYLKGHQKEFLRYGVLTPPEPVITRTASSVPQAKLVEWRNLPAPPNLVDRSGIHQYGFLEAAKGLYLTFKAFYAVSGEDHPSQVFVDRAGTVFGSNKLNGPDVPKLPALYTHNKVAGYMCRPPKGVDADYLVGLSGTPGSRWSSAGPSLYAVKFDTQVPLGQAQNATAMMAYEPGPEAMAGWDNITSVRGCAWIEIGDRQAVIFTGRRSVGHVWYGMPDFVDPKTGKAYHDPTNPNKGYHAEGYSQGFWIMDPVDVLKAYRGEIRPMDVKPVEWVAFEELGVLLENGSTEPARSSGWVAASYRDGRLIVGIEAGYPLSGGLKMPLMLEFRFNK